MDVGKKNAMKTMGTLEVKIIHSGEFKVFG